MHIVSHLTHNMAAAYFVNKTKPDSTYGFTCSIVVNLREIAAVQWSLQLVLHDLWFIPSHLQE